MWNMQLQVLEEYIVGYIIGINSWILSGEDTGFLPQISIHSLKHVL